MKKRFYIEAKCLKVSVNFFVGYTVSEMNNYLKGCGCESIDVAEADLGVYFMQENDDGLRFYGIWLPKFNKTEENLGTLAHELHHIVEIQAEEKGFDCMETKAYLMEYYLVEFLKRYNKK